MSVRDFWWFAIWVICLALLPFFWHMSNLAGRRAEAWRSLAERSKAVAGRLDQPDVTHLEREFLMRQLDDLINEGNELGNRSYFHDRPRARKDIPPL